MKYNYVVFDFNGTIIDDVDLCINLLNQMLVKRNIAPVTKDKYKEIFTFPIIDYYKKAGFTFDGYTFDELSKEFIIEYQPSSYKCNLFEGINEILDYLNCNGYIVILLSASERNNLMMQTDVFNITNKFEAILGLDNIGAHSKIDIAKEYFARNNIEPSKCLFIGDSLHDYEVASSLGGDVILVSYGHQNKERLLKANVPVIDSICEVKKYL